MSINIKKDGKLVKIAPTSYNELTDLPNIESSGDVTYITDESGKNVATIGPGGLSTTGIVVDRITLDGEDVGSRLDKIKGEIDFNDLTNNPISDNNDGTVSFADESGNKIVLIDSEGVTSVEFKADGHKLTEKADQSYVEDQITRLEASAFSGDYNDLENAPIINDTTGSAVFADERGNQIAKIDSEGVTSVEFIAGTHKLTNKAEHDALLADFTEDGEHQTVTSAEKTYWSNKSEFSGKFGDLTDSPIVDDNSGELIYTDGTNTIVKIDASGITTTNVAIKEGDVATLISEKADQISLDATNDAVNVLENKVSINEEKLEGVQASDGEFTITDGTNIGMKLDSEGLLHVREVEVAGGRVDERLKDIENYFSTEEDADSNLNKWHEIVDFLNGFEETDQVLENIINTKASKDELSALSTKVDNNNTSINTRIDSVETAYKAADSAIETAYKAADTNLQKDINTRALQTSLDATNNKVSTIESTYATKAEIAEKVETDLLVTDAITLNESEFIFADEAGNKIAEINNTGVNSVDFIAGTHKLTEKANKSDVEDQITSTNTSIETVASAIRKEFKVKDDELSSKITKVETEYKAADTALQEDVNKRALQTALDSTNQEVSNIKNNYVTKAEIAAEVKTEHLEADNITLNQDSYIFTDGTNKIAEIDSTGVSSTEFTAGSHQLTKKADISYVGDQVASVNSTITTTAAAIRKEFDDADSELSGKIDKKADQTAMDAANSRIDTIANTYATKEEIATEVDTDHLVTDRVTLNDDTFIFADNKGDGHKIAEINSEGVISVDFIAGTKGEHKLTLKADTSYVNDQITALDAKDAELSGKITTVETNYKSADENIKLAYAAADKTVEDKITALENSIGTSISTGNITATGTVIAGKIVTDDFELKQDSYQFADSNGNKIAEISSNGLSTTKVQISEGDVATLINNKVSISTFNETIESVNKTASDMQDLIDGLDGELDKVSGRVSTVEEIFKTDTDTVINKWGEVVTFLDGISSTTDLEGLLAAKANFADLQETNKDVETLEGYFDNGVAKTATNLASAPSLAADGNNVKVTAGGKTSSAFTIPFATNANYASSADFANSATTAEEADKVSSAFKIQVAGKDIASFDGSVAKTINFKAGDNISLSESNGTITITGDVQEPDFTEVNGRLDALEEFEEEITESYSTVTANSILGKNAHSWGNHAEAGYVKTEELPTLSGGSTQVEDTTVVGGVTVNGHEVTVNKKTITGEGTVSVTYNDGNIIITGSDHPSLPDALPNPESLTVKINNNESSKVIYDGSAEKTLNLTIPTKVTDLSDGNSYATQTWVSDEIVKVATGGNIEVPVKDVQINGTTVVEDKIAKITIPATITETDVASWGFVKTDNNSITGITVGQSGTTTNSSQTDPYIKIKDDDTHRSQIQLKGTGTVSVTSDANGVITINSTGVEAGDIDLSGYKTKQSVFAMLSGKGTTFVDTIVQNENGEIEVTTKEVSFPAEQHLGDITNVIASNGLTGGGDFGEVTISANIKDTTKNSSAAVKGNDSNKLYAVELDKDGKLAVSVPWVATTFEGNAELEGLLGPYENQNAFSNVKIGELTIPANSTTDTITLVAGNNIQISADAETKQISIASIGDNQSGDFKTIQSPINANASGNGVKFIDTISQNENGEINYTTKDVDFPDVPTKVSDLIGDELISSDDDFNIVDSGNNIILSVDANGLHTTNLTIGADSLDSYIINHIPITTTDKLGGIKTGYKENGKNYPVTVDVDGNAYVNVSWTDNDTSVTSVSNHYTPFANSDSELTATISGTAGTYAKNTEYTVLTGVKAQRDAKGHITGLTYTAQKIKDTNNTYTSLKNPYSLIIQQNGTTVTNGTYDGSAAKTVNITVPTKLADLSDGGNVLTSLTKNMVVNALGYEPPTENTTYKIADGTTPGLMTASFVHTSGRLTLPSNRISSGNITINDRTNTAGRFYGVEIHKATGMAYVNVPWTEGGGSYTLPTASASTLGGIKVGNNLSISNGVLSGDYRTATTSLSGLMSSDDKTKLNGIETGANNYVHPTTAGYKHIPSGGSSGQFLKYSSSGTATWNSLPEASSLASGVVTTTTQKFAGNKTFTGKVTSSSGFYDTSDERLKDFKDDIKIDFEAISKIPKKYFTWKEGNDVLNIGTSAQEVQKLYPELVNEQDGVLSVAYDKLSIVALAAIDELYNKNKEFETRLERLEKLLNVK